MRTRNLIIGVLALAAFAPFAGAASSFVQVNFQKLVGLNLVPVSTNYSYATQMVAPTVTAPTVFGAGSLSAGLLKIQVAALSATGTSSPSSEYATTSVASKSIYLSWATIPGATGYAVYVGTSTPGSEQSYFMATSTAGAVNTNYTLTSTSTPTYYSIPASGSGYFASIGSATTTFDTSGTIRAASSATTTTCGATNRGATFYNSANDLDWLCKAAGWTVIK